MSKNEENVYYGIVCENCEVFRRFPELRPAVGDWYWSPTGIHKKLLLVGESNYLKGISDEESVFRNPELWYRGDCPDKLFPLEWKNKCINKLGDSSNWKNYGSFIEMAKLAEEVLDNKWAKENSGHNISYEYAFYDYFLRPADATNGEYGFKPKKIDCKIARSALREIIKLLEIEVVIFVSKRAHDDFQQYGFENKIDFENVFIGYVHHPNTWKSNPEQKEKFKQLLSEHWMNM